MIRGSECVSAVDTVAAAKSLLKEFHASNIKHLDVKQKLDPAVLEYIQKTAYSTRLYTVHPRPQGIRLVGKPKPVSTVRADVTAFLRGDEPELLLPPPISEEDATFLCQRQCSHNEYVLAATKNGGLRVVRRSTPTSDVRAAILQFLNSDKDEFILQLPLMPEHVAYMTNYAAEKGGFIVKELGGKPLRVQLVRDSMTTDDVEAIVAGFLEGDDLELRVTAFMRKELKQYLHNRAVSHGGFTFDSESCLLQKLFSVKRLKAMVVKFEKDTDTDKLEINHHLTEEMIRYLANVVSTHCADGDHMELIRLSDGGAKIARHVPEADMGLDN